MFYQNFLKLCALKNVKPNHVTKELGLSTATATDWKKGSIPRDVTLQKVADYFGVTTDYLLGKSTSSSTNSNPVSENDIKVALFGGAEHVSDEDWKKVKEFVAFLKSYKSKDNK